MEAISRRLLFHIGPVGFWVELNEVVEILEQVSTRLDSAPSEVSSAEGRQIPFRRSMIPLVELYGRLGLAFEAADTALVLNGPEGPWALLVGRVDGMHPATEMSDRPLPRLLKTSGWHCFDRVGLLRGVPYLNLDLAACRAGSNG